MYCSESLSCQLGVLEIFVFNECLLTTKREREIWWWQPPLLVFPATLSCTKRPRGRKTIWAVTVTSVTVKPENREMFLRHDNSGEGQGPRHPTWFKRGQGEEGLRRFSIVGASPLARSRKNPGTVTIPQYRFNKTKQYTQRDMGATTRPLLYCNFFDNGIVGEACRIKFPKRKRHSKAMLKDQKDQDAGKQLCRSNPHWIGLGRGFLFLNFEIVK